MTTPDHDGDDLDQLISQIEELLGQLYARRDEERAAAANIEAERRRGAFYVIPGGVSTGIAAAVALGRRIVTRPAGAALTASAATAAVTAVATFALTHPGSGPPNVAQPPATHALPPVGHTNAPRVGPPKESTPGGPQPQPSGERPNGPPPESEPPAAPGLPTPTFTTTVEAPGPDRSCRILFPSLPILRRGLLCGHL